METVNTLLENYCSTVRPLLHWSATKTKALAMLQRDIGHWPLDDLSHANLVKYGIEREGSQGTLMLLLPTLAGALRTSRDLWQMPVDPAAPMSALRSLKSSGIVPAVRKRDRRVTNDELAAIRACWNAKVPPQVLDVLIGTPMRSGELVQLLWHDLDHDARTVLIRDRKHPTAKAGNHQTAPLLGNAWRATLAQPRRDKRIWPYQQAAVSYAFKSAATAAGLQDIRLHDLRHEGISRRFEQGWSIPQVAALSGHRSWAELKRYTHISPEQLHQLADKGSKS